jgi:hypothetical protein
VCGMTDDKKPMSTEWSEDYVRKLCAVARKAAHSAEPCYLATETAIAAAVRAVLTKVGAPRESTASKPAKVDVDSLAKVLRELARLRLTCERRTSLLREAWVSEMQVGGDIYKRTDREINMSPDGWTELDAAKEEIERMHNECSCDAAVDARAEIAELKAELESARQAIQRGAEVSEEAAAKVRAEAITSARNIVVARRDGIQAYDTRSAYYMLNLLVGDLWDLVTKAQPAKPAQMDVESLASVLGPPLAPYISGCSEKELAASTIPRQVARVALRHVGGELDRRAAEIARLREFARKVREADRLSMGPSEYANRITEALDELAEPTKEPTQ